MVQHWHKHRVIDPEFPSNAQACVRTGAGVEEFLCFGQFGGDIGLAGGVSPKDNSQAL